MSITYTVSRFNEETDQIDFQITCNDRIYEIFINLRNENLRGYLSVHPEHFLDTRNDTIVILPEIHNRLTVIIDGVTYKKAIQSDFDRWMYNLPNSSPGRNMDNVNIYNTILNYVNK